MTVQNARRRLALFWRAIRPWLIVRLQQPTTYVGLILKVAGALGYAVTDSRAAHLAELLAVIVGALLVAYNEMPPPPDPTDQAGA